MDLIDVIEYSKLGIIRQTTIKLIEGLTNINPNDLFEFESKPSTQSSTCHKLKVLKLK